MNKLPIIELNKLNTLHTGSLMSRRKALLECEESFELSDRAGYEKKPKVSETCYIEFKNTPEWTQAYEELKAILSMRENIQNKLQRKILRQKKAKNNKKHNKNINKGIC